MRLQIKALLLFDKLKIIGNTWTIILLFVATKITIEMKYKGIKNVSKLNLYNLWKSKKKMTKEKEEAQQSNYFVHLFWNTI